jgi:hypothetical protein
MARAAVSMTPMHYMGRTLRIFHREDAKDAMNGEADGFFLAFIASSRQEKSELQANGGMRSSATAK